MRVGLFDGSFSHQVSATLGGENNMEEPKSIKWVKDEFLPVTFFTDMCLDKVLEAPPGISKIAWLIEPPSLSDTHYKKAMILRDEFDSIMTFDRTYTDRETDFMFYALGGSWINPKKFGIKPKTDMVSMIASQKVRARGHKLRHAIAGAYANAVDLWGYGYHPIAYKSIGLSKYRYSIVVESCQVKGYFSEKLIDCISQGTIPIYWGCSDVGEYFDARGIIKFNDLDELDHILHEVISTSDYESRLRYARKNLEFCWRYRCAEDWITNSYEFIFEPCENNENLYT